MANKKNNESVVSIEHTDNLVKISKNKKKNEKEEVVEFIPSKYQKAIFDYVVHGQGNLIVEACSGSGKTTTILKCIDLFPKDKKVLFAAFNKDIVKVIEKRLPKDCNAEVRTMHSLGLDILRKAIPSLPSKPSDFKYSSFIQSDDFRRNIKFNKGSKRDYKRYYSNIRYLLNYSRCNLCGTVDEILQLAEKYSINTIGNEEEQVINLMEYGRSNLNEIDYTDMIWIPNVVDIPNFEHKYDYIVVDEVQDVNMAQLNLILKCFKLGTRGIFVGDEHQLIYGFTGTDRDSFNLIRNLPNTISLPLSISYRCSKNVVNYVHKYCDAIEAKEDAVEGSIINDCDIDTVQNGDAIICRNNAPLFKVYADLIEMGKKPKILGSDFGKSLITAIEQTTCNNLGLNFREDGVFPKLYYDLITERNKIADKYRVSIEDVYENGTFIKKFDLIQTLEILADGVSSSQELIDKIKGIFANKSKEHIVLTTAHKSKGLEFNNVYILCNSLFNKKFDKEWERLQEKNLAYVAYTRTRNNLCFINEKKYDAYMIGVNNVKSELKIMEKLLSSLYKTDLSYSINNNISNAFKKLDLANIKKNLTQIKTENIKKLDKKDNSVQKLDLFSLDEYKNKVKNNN